MGGVDVGTGGGKRAMNMEINMIPFIDLLMVTIMFLLITAVWVSFSRMNANAQIPGPPDPTREIEQTTPEKVLHLHINETEFKLIWKQGSTTAEEDTMERPSAGAGELRYDDLGKRICEQWEQHGSHKDKAERKQDQAILHTDNRMPFKEIIAVLDALYSCQREVLIENELKKWPVFNMSFSVR